MPRPTGYDWTADPLANWQQRRRGAQAGPIGPGMTPPMGTTGAVGTTGPTGVSGPTGTPPGFAVRLANMQNRFGAGFTWDPTMGPFGQAVSAAARGQRGVTGPGQ
jgi:hypothetical protein